jgi:hypothetical protein
LDTFYIFGMLLRDRRRVYLFSKGHIRSMIKNLEKRKDKAMIRSDTDDLWTKIETLQWVLYVIFAIKNERMVVI